MSDPLYSGVLIIRLTSGQQTGQMASGSTFLFFHLDIQAEMVLTDLFSTCYKYPEEARKGEMQVWEGVIVDTVFNDSLPLFICYLVYLPGERVWRKGKAHLGNLDPISDKAKQSKQTAPISGVIYSSFSCSSARFFPLQNHGRIWEEVFNGRRMHWIFPAFTLVINTTLC